MDRSGERLALIERLDRDGRVCQTVEVRSWPATVGRGFDNDLVLDDPHVAPAHVQIAPGDDGALRLSVLDGARNPVRVGNQGLVAGASLALPRGSWSIGPVRLRVRWPGEALAAERRWQPLTAGRGGVLAALLLWAMVAAEMALGFDPGVPPTTWLVPLLSVPLVLMLWAGLWGLLSKLFQHRFEFWPHVAIAARWGLASTVLRWGAPMLAFAFSRSELLAVAAVGGVLLSFGMLRAQALRVLPGHALAVTLLLGAGAVAFIGVQAVGQHQATDRWIGPLYLSQLGPPWMRLAPTVPVSQFIDEARALEARLAAQAADDLADEPDDND